MYRIFDRPYNSPHKPQIFNYDMKTLTIPNRERLLLEIDLDAHVEKSLLDKKIRSNFSHVLLGKLVAIEVDFYQGTPKFSYHHALELIQAQCRSAHHQHIIQSFPCQLSFFW
jgi:hypothetical protein